MEDRWLSVDEIAAHLGVGREAIYRWIVRRSLPAHRVGRLWKFQRSEVDAWVQAANATAAAPEAESPVAAAVSLRSSRARDEVDSAWLERDSVLGEITRRLVEAYRPERIWLFGSVARGEAGVDSDYDLLVVVPDTASPERRRSRLAYECLWGTGRAADVLVWTASRFQERLHIPGALCATVVREGRLLHAS